MNLSDLIGCIVTVTIITLSNVQLFDPIGCVVPVKIFNLSYLQVYYVIYLQGSCTHLQNTSILHLKTRYPIAIKFYKLYFEIKQNSLELSV